MKKLLILLLLAACGTTTPVAGFYKAEAAYTAVLQAAASYVALPRCVVNGPTICSQQPVVDRIRPAANSADAAIQAAEDTVRNNPTIDATFAIQAAQSAVQALSVILNQYNVKVQ